MLVTERGEGISAKAEQAARRWAARAAAKKAISVRQEEEGRADAAMRAKAKAQRQANKRCLPEGASCSCSCSELATVSNSVQEGDSDDDALEDGKDAAKPRTPSPPRLPLAASAEPLQRWANKELAARHATAGEYLQRQRDLFRSGDHVSVSDAWKR